MNPDTGEIRLFEDVIPKDWVGLDKLGCGKTIDLFGCRFLIVGSTIEPGRPGKVMLELEGVAIDLVKEAFGDIPTTTFKDAQKAFKERAKKKEWE